MKLNSIIIFEKLLIPISSFPMFYLEECAIVFYFPSVELG